MLIPVEIVEKIGKQKLQPQNTKKIGEKLVDFSIKNKKTGKLNRDAKVGLKI